MDQQQVLECQFRKLRCFFLLFTVLMKIILEKHITYSAFNFNDVSYTVNAQTIDSATFKFVFEFLGLVYIHFP